MFLPAIRITAPTVVIFSRRSSRARALVVGVLFDHPVQVGVDVGERGDHHARANRPGSCR